MIDICIITHVYIYIYIYIVGDLGLVLPHVLLLESVRNVITIRTYHINKASRMCIYVYPLPHQPRLNLKAAGAFAVSVAEPGATW